MGGVRFNEEQTQLLEKILDKLLEVKEIVKGMQVNYKRLQQSYKEEENGPIAEDEIVQEEKKNAALQICFHDQATESGGKEESVVTEESLIFNGEISETLVETGDLSPVSKGADSHHSGDIPEEFLTAQQLSALQEENEQARNNFPRPSLKKKQREDCENEVKSVSWNASGTLLAVCGRDESVWIWEMQPANELECISVLQGHIPDVKMIQWQPTTDVWFACSYDNTIKTWTDEAETIEEFGDTLSEEQIWGHLDRGREGKCESILIIHKVFLNVYGKMGRPWNKTLNFVEMSMYTSAAGSNFELLGHFSGVGSFNRMVSKAIQGNGEGRKQEFYKWERDFNLNKSLMFGVPVTPIIESLLQFKYHALTIYGLLRHWVAHPLCYRNIIPAVLDCLDVVYEIMNSRRSFRALQNVQVFCNGDLMKFENSCNKGRRAPHNPINKVVPENGLKFSLSSSRATGSPYEDEDEMVFWMVKGMKVMFIYSQIQEKPLPYYSLSAMNLVDKVLLRRGECYDPPRQ